MRDNALKRLSVIIANCNDGKYVGRAIESALALEWDDVEVIVVDDGSTDDSREVIAAYEDLVTAVYQDNATLRVARNRGYAMSTGDVIIFLDSDDVLLPALGRELARIWRPGISKIQVQMLRIDEEDRSLGTVFPIYGGEPSPGQIREWARRTTTYPTPPRSGNAYARWFLDRIFPIDDSSGRATDSVCRAVAPLLGDVVTIAKPLVGYREYGASGSDLMADPERFPVAIERARQRYLYACRLTEAQEGPVDERPLSRSRPLLQLRVASFRLLPHILVLPEESFLRLLRDILWSPVHPGPEPMSVRAQILVWSLLTLLAPGKVARRLIRYRCRRERGAAAATSLSPGQTVRHVLGALWSAPASPLGPSKVNRDTVTGCGAMPGSAPAKGSGLVRTSVGTSPRRRSRGQDRPVRFM